MKISLLLPFLVAAFGLILLIRLGFFFVLHPIRTFREMLSSMKERQTRRSFFLALAGTLGVGNIFGVSAGIMIGGAGSLFWLFVSSFFSMIIKYAETMLVFSLPRGSVGMSSAIFSAFPGFGRFFSSVYAGLTILLALFMGSAMQASAIVDVAGSASKNYAFISLIILFVAFLPCLLGGAKKIEGLTEILIPVTTIVYILMCIFIILMNFEKMPGVISEIFSSAFSAEGAFGGISAIAIKEGFARGILSNEAGVGTSALAHARSRGRSPHIAGLFGILEVFFDTTLLCMLTGFSILVSLPDLSIYKTPMSLVAAAFNSSLGDFSVYLLHFCIFAFAYSTIICWYFYGTQCADAYFPRVKSVYVFAFLMFLFCSVFFSSTILLFVTDSIIFVMAILTLSTIAKKLDCITHLSKQGRAQNK